MAVSVPDGSDEEIDLLKARILESAYNDQQRDTTLGNVPVINTVTAAKYYSSLESNSSSSIHLNSIRVSPSDYVEWIRNDKRVTKETLVITMNPNKANYNFTVERKLPDSDEKRRLVFPFGDVMGMKLTDCGFEFDLSVKPAVEVKVKKPGEKGMWQPVHIDTTGDRQQAVPSLSQYRVCISFVCQQPKFRAIIEKIPCLNKALTGGLKRCYSGFVMKEDFNPHELYPLLKDATLVRAVQLALLQLPR